MAVDNANESNRIGKRFIIGSIVKWIDRFL